MKTKTKSNLGQHSGVWYCDIDVIMPDYLAHNQPPDGEFFSILGFLVHNNILYERIYCATEHPLLIEELFYELDSDLVYNWKSK